MQGAFLMHRHGAARMASALPGKRLDDAWTMRRSFKSQTAATRGDWRAQIEGGSGTGGSDSSGLGDKMAAARGAERSNGKVSTATLPSPAESKPTSTAPAGPSAATPPPPPQPPSPWSQPAAATAKPASSAKPADAAQPSPQPQAPTAATEPAAASDSREGPLSLPTLDLVELLATPKNQSTAFTALAATSAILAVLSIVEPEAVLHLALPKAIPSDLDITFLRIVGVTLAASAAVEYSLKHAAESQLLKSATYQRLMSACVLKSAGFLAVLLINTPATFRLWNPLVWMSYACTAVAAGTINLSVISHTSGKGLAPPPLDLGAPQNSTSWGYTVCIALYLLTVVACFAPEVEGTLFTGDPYSAITPLVKGVWAPGFLLAGVMSYVLKDAADRGRLGASTFKNLNLGLAALEYGYSIIFGSAILSDQVDIDFPALSNLGGALLIATFALYTYATAKK
ncbi:hypothetical protein VOLCADRAFT_106429 [Volvox carteri f. nagariensis]|uniref:Uncharacterized protein n=1 Tax=Volvox carteri f. nagariensis TaxID=3068 RepID=D8U798_VOLCA|nr:uncharacterized protein VOLCADRAFT_106429 [Volvox carteri f. nagariensis]EFJ44446.1 hypothetical protein VOLCADRAFT_106429 [Volvox carteri f. nagariensis]|eukprot:XP_002954553.1 hypothetical protein VOLCADRAFT_106429 [Volvox carteri f. nagariensis]